MAVRQWRFIPFQSASAAENMAVDEAVFHESRHGESSPTLRLYNWQNPTLSLGMFQDIQTEINLSACQTHRVDVVRRITGGKAVLHAADFTYSLVAREGDPEFPPGILDRYRSISNVIASALLRFGVHSEMKKDKRAQQPQDLDGFCFSVPSQYELLVKGRKICGSAQARSKGAFLQHGSLLIDFDPALAFDLIAGGSTDRIRGIQQIQKTTTCLHDEMTEPVSLDVLCTTMTEAFESGFGVQLIPETLTAKETALRDRLIQDKYQTDAWNHHAKFCSPSTLSY